MSKMRSLVFCDCLTRPLTLVSSIMLFQSKEEAAISYRV
jgi:hypothetical protein